MSLSLLDLSDEVLLLICEATQVGPNTTYNDYYLRDSTHLLRLSQVNTRLRSVTTNPLWAFVTMDPSTAFGRYRELALARFPNLWSLIRVLDIDFRPSADEFRAIALSLSCAKNLAHLRLYDTGEIGSGEYTLPTLVTNALCALPLQSLALALGGPGDLLRVEDTSFNYQQIRSLRELILGSPGVARHLVSRPPFALDVLECRKMSWEDAVDQLAWAIDHVRSLVMVAFATEEPLPPEQAARLLSIPAPSEYNQGLRMLHLDSFGGVLDATDGSLSPFLQFISKTRIIDLSAYNYGRFHWDTAQHKAVRFPCITRLMLGPPVISEEGVWAVEDCATRESLVLLLQSLPALQSMRLDGWMHPDDFKTLTASSAKDVIVKIPCVQSVLSIVGQSTIRILEFELDDGAEDGAVVICLKDGEGWRWDQHTVM